MISYEPNQCWYKFPGDRKRGTEERSCGSREAHFYKVTKPGVAAQFTVFCWLCPTHLRAMERAGYVLTNAPVPAQK